MVKPGQINCFIAQFQLYGDLRTGMVFHKIRTSTKTGLQCRELLFCHKIYTFEA